MENIQGSIESMIPMLTTWGIRVVGVLVALFVLRIVAGVLANALARSLERRKFDATLSAFFANMVRYAVIVTGVIGCLGVFGIQTTSFAAVLAAAGFAVGMAMQGTLGNFASGVMLLVFRPYKIGDVVSVAGVTGSVVEIELFTTELKTPDAKRVVIPNGKIFGDTITNITHHPVRRVDVPVGTAYEADIDRTRTILEACIAKVPGVLADPAPQVFLKELGASSVDWQLRVWTEGEKFWDVYQSTIRDAKLALDQAQVSIPYPQMDLHLDSEALSVFGSRSASNKSLSATRPSA